MNALRKFLRHVLVWWLPGLAMLCVLTAGFAVWLVGSQNGTRLLLNTAAEQLDGQALDVNGSILRGLTVGKLDLNVGGARIDISDLHLDVHWRALGNGLLHVRDVSAQVVRVTLVSPQEPEPDEDEAPFTLPSLPVDIALDRVALGEFALLQDGQPLPVTLGGLNATFAAGQNGAQVRIASLRVGHEAGEADVSGQADLQGLADPWPFTARLDVTARGAGAESPLCQVDRLAGVVATSVKDKNGKGKPATGAAPPEPPCQLVLRADAAGSLDGIQAKLDGSGAGLALDVVADLAPRTALFLRSGRARAQLPDKSNLAAQFDLQAGDASGMDRIVGSLNAQRLNLAPWTGDAIPPALLTVRADVQADIENMSQLRRAAVDLRFEDGSRWNQQALNGALKAQVEISGAGAAVDASIDPLAGLRIHGLDVDLRLGRNRIRAAGELAAKDSVLTLDAQAPALDAFWPGVPGGAQVQGRLAGNVAAHRGDISASYTPARPRAGVLGQARAQANLAFAGGWGKGAAGEPDAALSGWRGAFSRLGADSAGFTVSADRPVTLAFLPDAVAPQWQWQVGQTALSLILPGKERLTVMHRGSRGGGKRWETAGQADNLVISAAAARQIVAAVDPDAASKLARTSGRVNAMVPEGQRRIALDVLWDLKFDGRLAGRARIARRTGDLLIPGDPPIPLGVKSLVLDLTATPATANTSRLDARVDLSTDKMGTINGTGTAVLAVDAQGGMALDPRQPLRANLNADIADLAWVGLFVGDSMEIGGALKANLQAQGTLAGRWTASGNIRGERLRMVRIDDGVRLVDGTLSARLDGERLLLDSLRFPASLRVMPAEWRTKEWITTNAGAKGGYAEAKGEWNIMDGGGNVRLTLFRFPALQRSDRYAMVSGTVDVRAAMPRLDIVGDLKADAGWVSLEILQGVPTLDDDVRVIRAGDDPSVVSTPLQTTMDIKFDMGPRFYITGMGLDAGLLGSIQVRLNEGRLTGWGQLRTRGGGIEAYGQRLRLSRGTITFQGRLDNPVLDIEALRTGQLVEAGVRVAGTAQRPRIDLVSYPEVSEVEKLSWLLLGRGPDESGSDAALLLSVASALLGGGQPFYKQLGLDDVAIRTGNMGSSGSILPDRTVAANVNRDIGSDLSKQFLVASRSFANGITFSVEQALSGSDIVGRASYRLARGLSLDVKGGSVNGISLVYRTLFGN